MPAQGSTDVAALRARQRPRSIVLSALCVGGGGNGDAMASQPGRNRTTWGPPRGHLQPFGAWRPGIPVDERHDVPRPKEFFQRYCNADYGAGRPLILRGAAKHMVAMSWSDANLLARHALAPISDVEIGLKETRLREAAGGYNHLGDFLTDYNHTDLHLVSPMPRSMGWEVELLPMLRCGGFLRFLNSHRLWVARGGTRSVVHKDDADNINCLFAGTKRFALVHPRWRAHLEAHPNSPSPPDRFGFVDATRDPDASVYGAFFGRLDVDAIDLERYPGWSHVDWHRADLEAGDCIYVPQGWYHQVRAGPSRTVNAHVWFWRPKRFHPLDCALDATGHKGIPLSDCTYGYVPPVSDGQSVSARGIYRDPNTGRRLTLTQCSCRRRSARRNQFQQEAG